VELGICDEGDGDRYDVNRMVMPSMYLCIGFVLDCALPPVRGMPYARYPLDRQAIPLALERLRRV
jgi:hypothetical protein